MKVAIKARHPAESLFNRGFFHLAWDAENIFRLFFYKQGGDGTTIAFMYGESE